MPSLLLELSDGSAQGFDHRTAVLLATAMLLQLVLTIGELLGDCHQLGTRADRRFLGSNPTPLLGGDLADGITFGGILGAAIEHRRDALLPTGVLPQPGEPDVIDQLRHGGLGQSSAEVLIGLDNPAYTTERRRGQPRLLGERLDVRRDRQRRLALLPGGSGAHGELEGRTKVVVLQVRGSRPGIVRHESRLGADPDGFSYRNPVGPDRMSVSELRVFHVVSACLPESPA